MKASKDVKNYGKQILSIFFIQITAEKIDLDIINDHGEAKLVTHKSTDRKSVSRYASGLLSGISDRKRVHRSG